MSSDFDSHLAHKLGVGRKYDNKKSDTLTVLTGDKKSNVRITIFIFIYAYTLLMQIRLMMDMWDQTDSVSPEALIDALEKLESKKIANMIRKAYGIAVNDSIQTSHTTNII